MSVLTLSMMGFLQSIVMGKAWRQEREAAGHVASTVRKQREMDAGAQLAFSFLFRVGFPTSVNPDSLTGLSRGLSHRRF